MIHEQRSTRKIVGRWLIGLFAVGALIAVFEELGHSSSEFGGWLLVVWFVALIAVKIYDLGYQTATTPEARTAAQAEEEQREYEAIVELLRDTQRLDKEHHTNNLEAVVTHAWPELLRLEARMKARSSESRPAPHSPKPARSTVGNDPPKSCPSCGLTNPAAAERCDCGEDLADAEH